MCRLAQAIYMKRKCIIVGLCVLLAALLTLYTGNFLHDARPAARVYATTEKKKVYLTFDDGPTDSTTPKILDILKREKVKATFFLIGRQAERRKETVNREVSEGHSIGIHSYSHEYDKIYASPEALLKDVEKCRKVIYDITGNSPDLYRFPGGSFFLSESYVSAVKQAGYRYYDWNASCRDSELKNATAEELYQSVVSTSAEKNKVILLCHDYAHNKAVVEILPRVITYFRESGYVFATL